MWWDVVVLKLRNSEVSQLNFFWISAMFLHPTCVAISGPEINQYTQEAKRFCHIDFFNMAIHLEDYPETGK